MSTGVPPESVSGLVLIVDDDPGVRSALSCLLQLGGYQTVTAACPVEAMSHIHASPPDLILSDVNMPPKSGFEFAAELAEEEKTKTIPLIFVSAMARPQDQETGLSLGAKAYVNKTCGPEKIMEVVRNHCRPGIFWRR